MKPGCCLIGELKVKFFDHAVLIAFPDDLIELEVHDIAYFGEIWIIGPFRRVLEAVTVLLGGAYIKTWQALMRLQLLKIQVQNMFHVVWSYLLPNNSLHRLPILDIIDLFHSLLDESISVLLRELFVVRGHILKVLEVVLELGFFFQ